MTKKNADYSGNSGSMKNFELSAEITGIKMSKGILTRLVDKVTRIGNLIDKEDGEVKDESIFDTIQDLINYSAILYYGLKIERGKIFQKDENKNEILVASEKDSTCKEERRQGDGEYSKKNLSPSY